MVSDVAQRTTHAGVLTLLVVSVRSARHSLRETMIIVRMRVSY